MTYWLKSPGISQPAFSVTALIELNWATYLLSIWTVYQSLYISASLSIWPSVPPSVHPSGCKLLNCATSLVGNLALRSGSLVCSGAPRHGTLWIGCYGDTNRTEVIRLCCGCESNIMRKWIPAVYSLYAYPLKINIQPSLSCYMSGKSSKDKMRPKVSQIPPRNLVLVDL